MWRRCVAFCLLASSITWCQAQESLIIEPDAGPGPLLNAIRHADHSIDLVIYGFTDQAFAAALISAQQHGKQVQVLMQQHPYMTDSENLPIISTLQNASVPLVFADQNFKLTHQKTFILDHNQALVMTFNLTHSTFKKERNFALLLNDPSEVQEIQNVFAADLRHQTVQVQNDNLIWSPDNARTKITALILSAHHTLKVYAESITDYNIVGALASAARNGTAVSILTSLESKKVNGKKFDYLRQAGVHIRISKHLIIHAKVLLIDNTTSVLGSINMTKPSIDSNRELAIISHDDKIYQQLDKTFASDWEEASGDKQTTISRAPTAYTLQQSLRQVMRLVKQEHRHSHTHKHHRSNTNEYW